MHTCSKCGHSGHYKTTKDRFRCLKDCWGWMVTDSPKHSIVIRTEISYEEVEKARKGWAKMEEEMKRNLEILRKTLGLDEEE